MSKEIRIGTCVAAGAGGATVRSFAIAIGTGDPLVVAKPAGLAVGDLMVCAYESWGAIAPETPYGTGPWAVLGIANGSTYPNMRAGLYYRWAAAADVAAASVASLVNASRAFAAAVIVWAVKDAVSVAHAGIASTVGPNPSVIDSGYTPTTSEDLFLWTTQYGIHSLIPISINGIDGGAHIFDYQGSPANYVDFAHASRPSALATGNVGVAHEASILCGYVAIAGSGGVPLPAFSVSRDSSGILLAVRDNAAPQFAVSRDADGIMLGAWR